MRLTLKLFLIQFISIFAIEIHTSAASSALKMTALQEIPSKTIIVTGHPEYVPFIWKSPKTGKLQGVAVEMLEKAFKELGVEVKTFNSTTWGRAQEEVKEGRADLLLPPYLNPERAANYQYYKFPFLMDATAVFIKKGKKIVFKKFDDLSTYRGTAIIDDSFGPEFDQVMKKKLKVERLATTEQCFEFLMSDRADYIIAGLGAGMAVVARLGYEQQIVILPKRIITTGMYAPISKKSLWNKPAIHEFINQRLRAYEKQGLEKKLEKKYWARFKSESK